MMADVCGVQEGFKQFVAELTTLVCYNGLGEAVFVTPVLQEGRCHCLLGFVLDDNELNDFGESISADENVLFDLVSV